MKSSVFSARVGKFRPLFVLLGLLLTPLLAEAKIEVERARAEFRDSRQFYRISEFFTGRENTGGAVIVRTQPDDRAGYYFTLRLEEYLYQKDTVKEAVRLEVIMPGNIEPTRFTFPLGPAEKKNPLILIGLTGADWPDPDVLPLAWRISFHGPDDELLAEAQSFLWSIETDRS